MVRMTMSKIKNPKTTSEMTSKAVSKEDGINKCRTWDPNIRYTEKRITNPLHATDRIVAFMSTVMNFMPWEFQQLPQQPGFPPWLDCVLSYIMEFRRPCELRVRVALSVVLMGAELLAMDLRMMVLLQ